jgi:hypothetical protein
MNRCGTRRGIVGVALCLLLAGATAGHAFIGINWKTITAGGAVRNFANTAVVPDGSLIQLIWSQDATMSAPDGTGTPTGNDYLLATGYIGLPDSLPNVGHGGRLGTYVYTDAVGYGGNVATFNAGYVYVRAWDAASPTAGSHYLTGGLATGFAIDPSTTTAYSIADLTGSSNTPLDTTLPVPEPGTISLLALGLATVILRRKKIRS